LAFASAADFIVTRDKKVIRAAKDLGFEALSPPELLEYLRYS
jgi:predicted nucleic acid-binding protein